MSVLAPSYYKEKKRVELNLVMFSQYWERAQYFFSKVEKLVMHLMIFFVRVRLTSRHYVSVLSTSELILKFVVSGELWILQKGKGF